MSISAMRCKTRRPIEEALEAYSQAIALRPAMADAHANMGAALEVLGRLGEAIAAYRDAAELDPRASTVRLWLHHKRRIICDWSGIEAEEPNCCGCWSPSREPPQPFSVLEHGDESGAAIARGARRRGGLDVEAPDFGRAGASAPASCASAISPTISAVTPQPCSSPNSFELHDRSRFEIFAYSHGVG